MNEIKQRQLLSILDGKITACAADAKKLELDHRRDEAIFIRIRTNVFDIFRTVFQTALRQPDPDAFFQEKLEQIPESWRAALQAARQHGDENKAHIEQIKLDAAAAVRGIFNRIQEARP